MTNIHQAAHSKPEHIPISFGFLYYRYSKIGDDTDLVARNAVLESAERRWAQVDQEVFIAAVIVNPLYKNKPFGNIPLTTRAGLMSLFSRLWKRFYGGMAPLELFTDLDNYLRSSPEFQPLDIYTEILVSHAKQQVIPRSTRAHNSESDISPLNRARQLILLIFGTDFRTATLKSSPSRKLPSEFSPSVRILLHASVFSVFSVQSSRNGGIGFLLRISCCLQN